MWEQVLNYGQILYFFACLVGNAEVRVGAGAAVWNSELRVGVN